MREAVAGDRPETFQSGWLETLASIPFASQLHWVLRIAVAGEFIGHGWVGTGRPAAWLPFFHVFGFNTAFARTMMPVVGTWDIAVGILILLLPLRFLLVWTAVWGLFTAFLRPLAGQGWWEFFERGGNYGVPFALLLLTGVSAYRQSLWNWLGRVPVQPEFSRAKAQLLAWVLRLTVASLLIGHGGIGAFMHRQAWTAYFHVAGISTATVTSHSLIETVGWFEIALGIAVLIKPLRGLLLFVFCWKVFTELLRPVAGEEIGQFIERFGSYGAPIALALVLTYLKPSEDRSVFHFSRASAKLRRQSRTLAPYHGTTVPGADPASAVQSAEST